MLSRVHLRADGSVDGLSGIVEDITDHLRAEQANRLMETVAHAGLNAQSPTDLLSVATAEICSVSGIPYGEVWLPGDDGRLIPDGIPTMADTGLRCLADTRHDIPPSAGLAWSAWEAAKTVQAHDLPHEPRFARLAEAEAAGVTGALAVPIIGDEGPLAVLQFMFRGTSSPSDGATRAGIEAAATQLGGALQRLYAEERYRELVECLPDIVLVHRDNEILFANRAGAEALGTDGPNDVIGSQFSDFVDPQAWPEVAIQLGSFAGETSRGRTVVETRYRRMDGACFDVEAIMTPIHWAGRDSVQIVARDTTKRRSAEHALQASELRYRTIVETAKEGVWLLDEHARTVFVNSSLAWMLGYEPSQMVGEPMMSFVFDEDRREARLNIESSRLGQRDSFEFRFRRRDGTELWAQVATSPLSENGRFTGSLGMITDITDRKRHAERLEQMVRSKDQMIATVSHELRTPLTAVLGFAEVLRERASSGDDEELAMLGTIAEQAGEMSYIVEDLLVAARTEEESVSVRSEPVDMVATVQSVVRSLGMTHRVTVANRTRVSALGDNVRLRQVLRNLFTNADRYGGTRIEVDIDLRGRSMVVHVRDDGDGVEADLWEEIFDPYVSLGIARGRPGSLGLGLTVSRRLARRMGGDLTSRRHAGWSVFELSLPVAVLTDAEQPALVAEHA